MEILIIWRDIPSPYDLSWARPFYSLKYSGDYNQDITLVSFRRSTKEKKFKYNEYDLQRYYDTFETINISKEVSSFKMKMIYTLKTDFHFKTFFREILISVSSHSDGVKMRLCHF